MDAVIKNGKVVSSSGIISAAIGVDKGKIVAISSEESLPAANKTIDARGNYVIPGLVDVHCHLAWPPSIEVSTNIQTETQAYAFGGCTTTSHMPFQIGDIVKVTNDFIATYEENAYIDCGLTAIVPSKDQIVRIRDLVELGILGFKLNLPYKGAEAVPGLPAIDDGMIYLTFEEIAKLAKEGYKVLCRVHCESIEFFFAIKDKYIKKGILPRSYHECRPSFIEEEAMRRVIYLANLVGCPLYIVHMTIKEGVDLVAKAKAEGINVIAETCPQYLALNIDNTDMVLSKINPPIRTIEDNERLWKGIRDGVVSVVATDHAPLRKQDKPDLWTASMGFTGAETWLSIMLSEGVNKGRISLEKLVEVCCYNPAKIYGLFPKKGVIAVGSDADLVIVDLNKEATVGERPVYSGTDYTPFAGFKFKGWPVLTMLRGRVIVEDGRVIGEPGFGRYCPAKVK